MAIGRKTGGRQKGSQNKTSVKLSRAASELLAKEGVIKVSGLTPLEVMLYAMRLEVEAGDWRMAAALAEKAAPYVHPKLAPRMDDADKGESTIRIVGGLPDE